MKTGAELETESQYPTPGHNPESATRSATVRPVLARVTMGSAIQVLTALLFSVSSLAATAQTSGYTLLGSVQRRETNGHQMTFHCQNGKVRLSFLNEDVVRVHLSPAGKEFPADTLHPEANGPYFVAKYDWPGARWKMTETFDAELEGDIFRIAAGNFIVKVRKNPFRLAFYDRNENPLVVEKPGVVNGGLGFRGGQVFETMHLPDDEHFFGFGAHNHPLDMRGRRIVCAAMELEDENERGGFPTPFFYSTRGYGLFFNCLASDTAFDLGTTPGEFSFSATSGGMEGWNMDYYVIRGPAFADIARRFFEIVGRSILPEKWIFVHIQSHCCTWNAKDLVAVANRYRANGWPLDVLQMDYQAIGPDVNWAAGFSDPAGLFRAMDVRGIKNSVSCALFDDIYDWKTYDPTVPASTRDFWSRLAPRVREGVDLWRQDNSERSFLYTGKYTLANGYEARNLFGSLWAKNVVEGMQSLGLHGRPVISRGGPIGGHRYILPWAGDMGFGLDQLPIDLNYLRNGGLGGYAAIAVDLGGFIDRTKGSRQPLEEQNVVRRVINLIPFVPVSKLHGSGDQGSKLPWLFTPEQQELFARYLKLRYRLNPYIYSAAIEAHLNGRPILAPLVWDYTADPRTYRADYEFMLGRSLLVAPVLRETETWEVYLPRGQWTHYWSGQTFTGGQTVTVAAPLYGRHSLPLFVKAGAIIPLMPEVNFVGEKPSDPLTLDVYPLADGTSDTLIYDAKTPKDDDITTSRITCADDKTRIELTLPALKQACELWVHLSQAPREVRVDDKPLAHLENLEAFLAAETGWYFGPGRFAGSDTLPTLDIKLGRVTEGQTVRILKEKETAAMPDAKKSFKLALLQMRVRWGDKAANLAHAEELIAEAARNGADIALLPECFEIGWSHPKSRDIAEPVPDGSVCRHLAAAARKHRVWVCSGLVERDGTNVFNTAVLLDRDGVLRLKHRKVNECEGAFPSYDQGDRLNVVPTEFGTIGLMICADAFARDRILSRALGYLGADVILSPSAWVVPATHDNSKTPYSWLGNYEPVAKEFKLWIAGASNVGWIDAGPSKGEQCIGCSLVVGPDGQEVLKGPFGPDAEKILYVDITPAPRPARGCAWESYWKSTLTLSVPAAATAVAADLAAATPRDEALQQIRELEHSYAGQLASKPADSRIQLPPRPRPGLDFFVAPRGNDLNPGTRRQPFATLERARDEIRARRKRGGLPAGGVQIIVRGGEYHVSQTFKLEAQDSGSALAPVVFRAAQGERPIFSGGVRLRQFSPVSDEAVRARLPAGVRGKVLEADLAAHGLTNVRPLTLGGFASGRGFSSHPLMELYFDGRPLPLARSPGWGEIAEVSEPEREKMDGFVGSKTGRFTYAGDRPARWMGEPEVWLYGYFFFAWADSYEKVAAIDPTKREIVLAPPFHRYGYRQGQRFYAVNALAELDEPGEWCLDSARRRICFLPPSKLDRAVVELSVADFPFVQLEDASHVVFEGLIWELGCMDAVVISGGANCRFAGCTVRRFAGNGVTISGGTNHGILSSDICTLGRGGVTMSGGDRKTLVRGGHFVENCHIHDLSRIDHTYTPAVVCSGVGQRIAHNWFHDIPSSALRVGGNDHVIEFNEINRVVIESDDQGGVDMWGGPTLLGNVYRHNYFHHIGNWREPEKSPECGQAGIRLDDAVSGVLIHGNVFYRCGAGKLGFGGVQIHGGKDNVLDNNVFADCRWAVSFSPWPEARWNNFTRPKRNAAEIDPALYAAHYPAMSRLDADLNVNWLCRNLVFNCGAFLHRDRGDARAFDNLVTTNNPGFADPARGNFAMKKVLPSLRDVGFGPLPFNDIGLYRDVYRRTLPRQSMRQMRAEPPAEKHPAAGVLGFLSWEAAAPEAGALPHFNSIVPPW